MSKSNISPSDSSFLDTLAGESAFFRAICDARPVGVHREFHMMAVAVHVKEMTGRYVSIDELWDKFRRCYDIRTLEGYEKPGFESVDSSSSSSDEEQDDAEGDEDEDEDAENDKDEDDNSDDMDVDGSKSRSRTKKKPTRAKPLRARDTPRPGDDLLHHPFFRAEFALPVGNGWPPPPPSSVAGDMPIGASAGGASHSRKDSIATTTTATGRGRTQRGRKVAAPAEAVSTRGGPKGARGKAAAATAMSVNESDSDLTSEGGEKDASGDGEDAEGEDVEENDGEKEEAEVDAEEGAGTRRSTRTRGTATKDTNPGTKAAVTKKRRGK